MGHCYVHFAFLFTLIELISALVIQYDFLFLCLLYFTVFVGKCLFIASIIVCCNIMS